MAATMNPCDARSLQMLEEIPRWATSPWDIMTKGKYPSPTGASHTAGITTFSVRWKWRDFETSELITPKSIWHLKANKEKLNKAKCTPPSPLPNLEKEPKIKTSGDKVCKGLSICHTTIPFVHSCSLFSSDIFWFSCFSAILYFDVSQAKAKKQHEVRFLDLLVT